MKSFYKRRGRVDPCFEREARMINYSHSNLIHYYDVQYDRVNPMNGKSENSSVIVMEYAPHGDFHDLLKKKNFGFD